MRNLNRFVRRSASALGSSGKTPTPRLTEADIRELSDAVKNPSFDVYVGKQDNLIRRVSGRIEFDIPEAEQERLGGLKGGSIKFSVELRNVNGDQQIEAPTHSRPLSTLTDSLGGALDALGGRRAARPRTSPDPRRASPTTRATPSSSATTPTASTRRAPRTPRRSSSARTCCRRRSYARRLASGPARGRCPSARATSACAAPSAQRSGASSPSWSGRRALEQHRAAVVADGADLARPPPRRAATRPARRPAPPAWPRSAWRRSASSIRVGATHATAGWARFQAQASCSGDSEWRSAIGRSRSSLARPASTQPVGPEAAVVAARELVARQHVVPEQAAVVDDARDDPHAVALGGGQRQLARPGLQRPEDQHRPVDQLAVALEAADHVEREAVGGPGRDPQRARQPLVAQRAQRPPTPRATRSRAGRGCAAAARRRRPPRSARGCARRPCAGSRRTRRGRAGAGR